MKNKIIITASIKGGVGKSTLCCLLASYLTEKGVPVAVLDADIQQSIMHHREQELKEKPDASVPWQLNSLLVADGNEMIALLAKIKRIVNGCVIIDCPGNVQDATLKYIFNAADIAIVPFHYDCDSVDATRLFLNMLRKVSNCKIMLLPNRVVPFKDETAYDAKWRIEASKLLSEGDVMLARIKNGKSVPKYRTLDLLDKYQMLAVDHAFETILKEITTEGTNDGESTK